MAKIKEIFKSIQGEGPCIGYEQLFIRFCGCNLNCEYCDTDFTNENVLGEFTPEQLFDYVNDLDITNIHSISLTGGEPLLSYKFLKEFLPLLKEKKIYLETNATLPDELNEIIDYVDIVAADIKLQSATNLKNTFDLHGNFFDVAKNKKLFAKVVFNDSIAEDEITKTAELARKYDIELVLQPQMLRDQLAISSDSIEKIFAKFLKLYKKVRLIPQVHKFINVQ